MEYNEDDFLQLSGLQHFLFCKRQWALIHIEQQWKENIYTTEGMLLHQKVHNPELREKRRDIVRLNAIRIHSFALGVSGECDALELHSNPDGIEISGESGKWELYPVEYKRGKKKVDVYDEAQLCGQAICLEEMYCCSIKEGAIFYGETRRREKVYFTDSLRKTVIDSLNEMHMMLKRGHTPKTKEKKCCKSCSLKEICLPGIQERKSVTDYLSKAIRE